MQVRNALLIAFLTITSVLFPARSYSQGSEGSIGGHVTDQTKANVAGAEVKLTNTATAQTITKRTSTDGYYTFPALLPGAYSVRVTQSGFKTYISDMVLEVAQNIAADVELQVGAVDAVVQVDTGVPLMDPDTSSTGQVIDQQQIQDLPLNGRNVLSLALLVPGASENPGAQSQFTVNGGRGNETSTLLDGVDARLFFNGTPAISPTVDAVQQFKIQQSSNSAAYGDGLAVINIAIRSGGNQFHGDVWEFIRNDALDAKGYFNRTVPILKQNEFGLAAGGPIYRNHTFFFGSYEAMRRASASTVFAQVPTEAQWNGNFAGSAQLYDPYNLIHGVRTPYPNNQIPASEISKMGRAAAALYPRPNITSPFGNYVASVQRPVNIYQYNIRVDHQISVKDSLFARFSRSGYHVITPNSPMPYNANLSTFSDAQALFHETHVFSSNLLNQAAFGWTYAIFAGQLIRADHDIATQDFGLANLIISPISYSPPLLSITNVTALGAPTFFPSGARENNYQFDDDLTWTHNKHTLQAGFEARQYRPLLYTPATPNGNLNFDGRFTSKAYGRIGNATADLLLGDPFTASVTQTPPGLVGNGITVLRWNQYQTYLQDDWKATPRLTVNLGMRYQYQNPYREVHNEANVWSQGCNCFLTPGAGIDGLVRPNRTDFAPRFGFAYSLTPKTIIHAGSGLYYGFIRGGELSSGWGLNPPFAVSTTVNSKVTAPTLGQGVFPTLSTAITPSTNLFSVDHNFPDNYTYQFNLTVQREITPTSAVKIAYVGSLAHRLTGRDLINQAHLDVNPAAPTSVTSRRPYQGAGDISITRAIDQANYNSLQVTGEKRPSHGVSFLAAYTYSKALGISEGGDQSSIGNEYAPRSLYYGTLPYSQKHRLTVAPSLELPVGRGKPFLNKIPSIANKVVGGWSGNIIGTFFTGEYATPSSAVSPNVGRADRNPPNCLGNPNLSRSQRTVTKWFDTSKIVNQRPGTFGNCASGLIQVAGENNVDIGIIKRNVFAERYRTEFRAEFFNAFNHPSFGQPNLTPGTTVFGVISSTRTIDRQIQFGLKIYW